MIATENQCKHTINSMVVESGVSTLLVSVFIWVELRDFNVSAPIKMKTGNEVFDQNAWERIVLYSSYSYIIKLHYMYLESVCRAPLSLSRSLPVRSFCPPLKIMFDTSISGLLHFKTETNSFFSRFLKSQIGSDPKGANDDTPR